MLCLIPAAAQRLKVQEVASKKLKVLLERYAKQLQGEAIALLLGG